MKENQIDGQEFELYDDYCHGRMERVGYADLDSDTAESRWLRDDSGR